MAPYLAIMKVYNNGVDSSAEMKGAYYEGQSAREKWLFLCSHYCC